MRERSNGFHQPQIEAIDPAARRRQLASRLKDVAVAACTASAAVAARFRDAGIDPASIGDPDDLDRLPILKKSELSRVQSADPPLGGLATVATSSFARLFVSPGPIYDPEGTGKDYWHLAAALHAGGLRPGDIVQNTFSYHLTPAGLMFDTALREMGCAVVPAGTGNTEIQARTMRDLSVTAYVGTPSFLVTILEKGREMGFELGRGGALEVAYVAGEMLSGALRRELETAWGLHVRQGYITADVGTIAYECGEKDGYHLHPETIVGIVDPDGKPLPAGEVGQVVVTSLKHGYPLFRFGTGDLSAVKQDPCPCGRTTPRLVGVLGRADEVTKVRGMFIHPGQVAEILARIASGCRGQAVVTREGHQDRLLLRLVIPAEIGTTDAVGMAERAGRDVLKLRVEAEVITADQLGERPKTIDDRRTWE
jgi:phenylacetate-CoA ligase